MIPKATVTLVAASAIVALMSLSACSTMRNMEMSTGMTMPGELKLSGDQEVPPVTTSAMGVGKIAISDDGAVSGSVVTKGIEGTMAHIHTGAMGKNGPVIIPLIKSADGNTWTVPAGSKLTPDQMKMYQSGELYVNVHSAANKGGEIRAQLKS
jgi:CHRD domain